MEQDIQLSQQPVSEFGRWHTNKYGKSEIFKAAHGISVGITEKKGWFGVNLIGKDLQVSYKDANEAKQHALTELKALLEEALANTSKELINRIPTVEIHKIA